MPERNHEVVIDGYVFPDTVTVTLANDEHDKYVNSRDYVSKELYESVCGANDAWQAENTKLRELAAEAIRLMQADGPDCGLCKHYHECWADDAMNYSPSGCVICNEARELGVGATDE